MFLGKCWQECNEIRGLKGWKFKRVPRIKYLTVRWTICHSRELWSSKLFQIMFWEEVYGGKFKLEHAMNVIR